MKKQLNSIKKTPKREIHQDVFDLIYISSDGIALWTDLNVGIKFSIDATSDNNYLVYLPQLRKIASKFNILEFSTGENKHTVNVHTSAGTFKIPDQSSKFPEHVEYLLFFENNDYSSDGGNAITKDLLSDLSKYTKDYETRPALSGIFFDSDHLVATDGNIMKFVNFGGYNFSNKILPSWVVPCLSEEFYKICFHLNEGMFNIVGQHEHFIIQAIDDKFPAWRSAIPQEFTGTIQMDHQRFKKAIESADMASNDATNQIELNIKGDEMIITAHDINLNTEFCGDPVPVEQTTGDARIGLSSKFVLSILSGIKRKDGRIEIKYKDVESPVIFNDDTLLMPIHLNERK